MKNHGVLPVILEYKESSDLKALCCFEALPSSPLLVTSSAKLLLFFHLSSSSRLERSACLSSMRTKSILVLCDWMVSFRRFSSSSYLSSRAYHFCMFCTFSVSGSFCLSNLVGASGPDFCKRFCNALNLSDQRDNHHDLRPMPHPMSLHGSLTVRVASSLGASEG